MPGGCRSTNHVSLETARHAGTCFIRLNSTLPPLSELEEAIWDEHLGSDSARRDMFVRLLRAEAQREGVSVAELVRVRCEHKPHPDDVVLGRLTAELREALRKAKSSLKEGLSEAQSTLAELRASRPSGAPTDHPQLSRSPGK